jgi:hypothetical protein
MRTAQPTSCSDERPAHKPKPTTLLQLQPASSHARTNRAAARHLTHPPPRRGRRTEELELAARMAGEEAAACAPQVDGHAPPRDAPSFDEETRALIAPDAGSLPVTPPSAVEANFARYFAAGKKKDSNFLTL